MADENLHEMAKEQFEQNYQVEQEWAEQAGVEIEPLEALIETRATGNIEWGGAVVAGSVTIKLNLDSGENLKFDGIVYGNIAGYASGKGVYHGARPKTGEKWNFHMTALDAGGGAISITFNPILGPRGNFVGGTMGAGVTSIENFGGGVWKKG